MHHSLLKLEAGLSLVHVAGLVCENEWSATLGRNYDVVFIACIGFSSRFAHARLQISLCNGYDLLHPG